MKITPAEQTSCELDISNLDLAVEAIADKGYVILEDVFDESWIKQMRGAVSAELRSKYAALDLDPPGNHGGIECPIRMPFIDPHLIENGIITQVLERVLGPRYLGHLPYGCNTAFPGSIKQNVHRDAGHIFPEIRSAVPPLLLVVNVALDDFTADNGATEIWPCSHLLVDADEEESATLKIPEERSKEHPSTQTTMTAGSVIVRDMRTWHRGMPNKTGQPRTMLMLVFYRQYFIPDSFSLLLSEEELNQFSDKSKMIYRLRAN